MQNDNDGTEPQRHTKRPQRDPHHLKSETPPRIYDPIPIKLLSMIFFSSPVI